MTAETLKIDGRTNDGDKYSRAAADTYKGMAGWAGWGPTGMTCRQCDWYGSRLKSEFSYVGKKHGRPLKDHYCHKRRQLNMALVDSFPHRAKACQYFEPSSNPPPAFRGMPNDVF